jgi:hypothetical protein
MHGYMDHQVTTKSQWGNNFWDLVHQSGIYYESDTTSGQYFSSKPASAWCTLCFFMSDHKISFLGMGNNFRRDCSCATVAAAVIKFFHKIVHHEN